MKHLLLLVLLLCLTAILGCSKTACHDEYLLRVVEDEVRYRYGNSAVSFLRSKVYEKEGVEDETKKHEHMHVTHEYEYPNGDCDCEGWMYVDGYRRKVEWSIDVVNVSGKEVVTVK